MCKLLPNYMQHARMYMYVNWFYLTFKLGAQMWCHVFRGSDIAALLWVWVEVLLCPLPPSQHMFCETQQRHSLTLSVFSVSSYMNYYGDCIAVCQLRAFP